MCFDMGAPLNGTHIHPLKCTFTNTLFLITFKLLTIPIPQCAKNFISETHFLGYSLVIVHKYAISVFLGLNLIH